MNLIVNNMCNISNNKKKVLDIMLKLSYQNVSCALDNSTFLKSSVRLCCHQSAVTSSRPRHTVCSNSQRNTTFSYETRHNISSSRILEQQTRLAQDSVMYVFDRQAKLYQRERAARNPEVALYDYLKEEIGFRLADRILDIKRKFHRAADLGCGRGYVSRHILPDCVEELILCDMCESWLAQANCQEGIKMERKTVDEEKLPFDPGSLDLVISSLSLHWVNDLPGTFMQIMSSLKPDGVFLAAVFGGETLFELRSSLQLAELEREGGIAAHVSPFTEIRDIGGLLNRAGFAMQTVDTDEIVVGYPSAFELMHDLKGMGENNAARNRKLRLGRDTMFAAASIYQEMYGKVEDGMPKIPATFQVIYMLGWKPDKSQPKPLERGTGKVSIKDLHRIDEIISETKILQLDENEKDSKK